MNTVTDVLIHLPRSWWLIPLGAAVCVAFIFYLYRTRWRGLLALTSLLSAFVILFFFWLTWKSDYDCRILWETPKPPFATVHVGICHGKLLFMLDLQREGHPTPGYGAFVVSHRPNQVSSMLVRKDFSLLRNWPFVEDKIGFQLAHFHGGTLDSYSMTMPHWMAILIFCPWFPLFWYLRRRRQLRRPGFPVAELATPPSPTASTPCARAAPSAHTPPA